MARYVVTAGSGDTYRIERIHLDRDQAYRFMRDYNGIAPIEPAQVEELQAGRRQRPMKARIGVRSGGRGSRPARGEALPEATLVRRELAGVPRLEVVVLSKEKGGETSWDAVTQVRADLAGVPGK